MTIWRRSRKRRTFSAEYKLRIDVIEWRKVREADALDALADRRTSAVRPKKASEQAELERLRKKVARLEKDLARRDAALEVMGKANALLGLLSESAD
ncbi:hypothetical protein ACWCY6_28305 [Streptomyces sp. 900105755]